MTENEWFQFMVLVNGKVCSDKFVYIQSKEILKMTRHELNGNDMPKMVNMGFSNSERFLTANCNLYVIQL